MHRWRYAVITYLRSALNAHLVDSCSSPAKLRRVLTTQYERLWNIHIDHFGSKEHFLRYAGRYVRRPPIAQYRFVEVGERHVIFRTNAHKQHREVLTVYQAGDFIGALAHHVPDDYKQCHSVLRPNVTTIKMPAISCAICLARATTAPAPHAAQLGLLNQKRFRDRPAFG